MASSTSVIKVLITGDAKKLIGAVNQADLASGGLVKSGIKVAGVSVAIKKGFDLIGNSLQEADRRGDALQRLDAKLGDLDDTLIATSDDFSKIGASSQDILELEAAYADLATSAGVGKDAIAANAEQLSIAALAMAQVHDADPSAILDAIGKAVGGQTRGLKQYGVDLTEAAVQQRALADTGKESAKQLTAQELAAARTSLILEAMAPIISDITSGTTDLAQRQDELGAKFETVMGKIGAGVEGPLTDVLTFINDEIDAIPGAIAGWQMLGAAIEDFGRMALGPLGNVADVLREIISLFDNGQRAFQVSTGRAPRSDRAINDAVERERARNGLGR